MSEDSLTHSLYIYNSGSRLESTFKKKKKMAGTAPITTSATATTATGPVTALTTTFTPPAKCTEQSLMFTMLSAPNYEVWANVSFDSSF